MGTVKGGYDSKNQGYKPKTTNVEKLKTFLNKINDKLGTNTK